MKDNSDKGFSKDELLRAQSNSYSPFSKFKVAAAVKSEKSGKTYYGCNVENATYGATICAERTALVKMVSEEGPEAKIEEVRIISISDETISPCGVCRQSLYEFSDEKTTVISYSKDFKMEKKWMMDELLPDGFKFSID